MKRLKVCFAICLISLICFNLIGCSNNTANINAEKNNESASASITGNNVKESNLVSAINNTQAETSAAQEKVKETNKSDGTEKEVIATNADAASEGTDISTLEEIGAKNLSSTSTTQNNVVVQKDNSTALTIVKNMAIGWNLGNTLDSCDLKKTGINSVLKGKTPEVYYENLWGNPITTKAMIDKLAQAGFGAVRIPVTYYDHMDKNYQIRKEWLNRVEEVVKYVLSDHMYCIINIHHEGTWLNADKSSLDANKEHLGVVWSQIAEKFKSYDDHLVFEGFNELLDKAGNWTNADKSSYDAINQLNQRFVDTVRNSSENNKSRYLIVSTYGANSDQKALDSFQLPKDSISNHLIVQIHTYSPQQFTWTENEVKWDKVHSNWIDGKDNIEIDKTLSSLNTHFISKGIPVVIGEFAAYNKNNSGERAKYAKYVVSSAKKLGITCFWWDAGGIFKTNKDVLGGALLNRSNITWYFQDIVDALVKSAR